ncbi:hypothetical protein PsorP6_002023 [Peronosclerospora sorghi]|uniref:Uncharacterized protein n=1 Tax=Peronosclerospora sorghi TaxID=230839 RepID=A0ACC0WTQ5_9STRA|nr:hypothetical protein PsorP6_002023 [Peronosclerospora sorghi]
MKAVCAGRTAHLELTEEKSLAWKVNYKEGMTSSTNSNELLEEVQSKIEVQQEEARVIANIAQARIKIWTLAEDRVNSH